MRKLRSLEQSNCGGGQGALEARMHNCTSDPDGRRGPRHAVCGIPCQLEVLSGTSVKMWMVRGGR